MKLLKVILVRKILPIIVAQIAKAKSISRANHQFQIFMSYQLKIKTDFTFL